MVNHSSFVFPATALLLLVLAPVSPAQKSSPTVIWSEPSLPSPDSAAASPAQLAQIFPGARIVPSDQLAAALADTQTRLLILAHGSAIPESAFSAISNYLRRGGDLLVLGGRPFTRAAYRDGSGWHLRDYSTRLSRSLQIDQYDSTPGSSGAVFTRNPDIPIDLPPSPGNKPSAPSFDSAPAIFIIAAVLPARST